MNSIRYSIFKNLNVMYIHTESLDQDKFYNSFKSYFFNLYTYNDINIALKEYNNAKIDLIITDINEEIFKFIEKINEIDSYQCITILTNTIKDDYFMRSFDLYVDNYISRALDLNTIYTKLETVVKKLIKRKQNIRRRSILQTILDNQSGIAVLTDFNTISFCSKSFLNFFKVKDLDEYLSIYSSILDIFSTNKNYLQGKTKEEFLASYKEAKAIKKVVLLLKNNLTPTAFHIHIDKIDDLENEELYLITLTNISIMQKQNIEISHKAYIDGLTGIYNRNKFEELFEYELSKYKRYNKTFSIAVLDIDYFKKFNDTYGHLIGDEVLISMANTITNNIRDIDTIARWGGEEFVLIMPLTDQYGAKTVCENLRKIIAETKHPTAGSITSSFGITQINKGDSLNTIFKRADKALYNAKKNGRNRVEILV